MTLLNKTGAGILLMVIGGLIIPSALFLLMTGQTTNKVEHVIMTIVDEGPNQDIVLQTQFKEENPKAIILERSIDWVQIKKVEQTIGYMPTPELTILDMTFTDTVGDGSGNDLIVVTIGNTGTAKVSITQVNFNEEKQTNNWKLTSGEDIIKPGSSDTVIQIAADWTAGNKYKITFYTPEGILVGAFITWAPITKIA